MQSRGRAKQHAVQLWRMNRPQTFEARCIFFAHYICGTGKNDALDELYTQSPVNDVLAPTLDAVSLVFAGFRFRDDSMVRSAARKYNQAVKSLRVALGHPKQALADSTLQAVLLLDIYEKISSPHWPSTSSELRMAHAQAALTLISLRRKEDLLSTNGKRLGGRVLSCVHVNMGLLQKPMPTAAKELAHVLAAAAPPGDLSWACVGTLTNVLNFALSIKDESSGHSDEVLARALELYVDTIAATEQVQYEAHRVRRATPKDGMMYGEYYNIYEDHHKSRLGCLIPMMRIIPLSMLTTLYFLDSEVVSLEEHLVHSRDLELYIEEVVASAPQWILPSLDPGNSIPFNAQQVIVCYPLLTFLWIAGSATSKESLRTWIRRTFAYMADGGGMEAARHFELGSKKDYHVGSFFWRSCTLPGSYSFVACGPGACMEF